MRNPRWKCEECFISTGRDWEDAAKIQLASYLLSYLKVSESINCDCKRQLNSDSSPNSLLKSPRCPVCTAHPNINIPSNGILSPVPRRWPRHESKFPISNRNLKKHVWDMLSLPCIACHECPEWTSTGISRPVCFSRFQNFRFQAVEQLERQEWNLAAEAETVWLHPNFKKKTSTGKICMNTCFMSSPPTFDLLSSAQMVNTINKNAEKKISMRPLDWTWLSKNKI